MPEELRDALDCVFLGRDRTVLAGGVTIDEDYFSVVFPFDGRMVKTEATFADVHQLLIGTGLLESYTLEINFPAGTVRLERVENT